MKMRKPLVICSLAITVLSYFSAAYALDVGGEADLEWRIHPYDSVSENDHHSNLSFVLQPEFVSETESVQDDEKITTQFEFSPFLRLDEHDSSRTHIDVRELYYEEKEEELEWLIGIHRVDFGTTASFHVINIVNQFDLIEHPVYQRKLGQPMLRLGYDYDNHHLLEGYLLPGFRERTFAGRDGRIRLTPRVDVDQARYESGAEEYRTDALLRYNYHDETFDVGIYEFWGTSRDPSPELGSTPEEDLVITPYYPTIRQTGVDATVSLGEMEYRLEWISRTGQGPHFQALIGGFQYHFENLIVGQDLYFLGEYHYGDTGSGVVSPFDNDWFAGFILNRHDSLDTNILVGDVVDTETDSHTPLLAAYFTLSEKVKLDVEYRGLVAVPPLHALGSLRKEDFLQVLLRYLF